jgi:hypothetical protein
LDVAALENSRGTPPHDFDQAWRQNRHPKHDPKVQTGFGMIMRK